jgi:hypothetical protein
LSQTKNPKEIFKKIKGAMERKVFSLTDPSGTGSSDEGKKKIAQLGKSFT